jgi:ribosomal protein S18 acetylase RimI-like enzyme
MNKINNDIVIRKLRKDDKIPIELLLLADPSKDAINEYINRGTFYIALMHDEIIGAYILLKTRPYTMELINISVKEEKQGLGIGKIMVLDAIEKTKKLGQKTLEVGTGNSSLEQLALYQKCGFRITGIDRNFFIKHYPAEIIENGIRCIDMIRLSREI